MVLVMWVGEKGAMKRLGSCGRGLDTWQCGFAFFGGGMYMFSPSRSCSSVPHASTACTPMNDRTQSSS